MSNAPARTRTTWPVPALYFGTVMHERLAPVHHRFTYGVFSMLLDVDRLAGLAARLRLFSHNRFNLFSFHDRDHGPRDGTSLRSHVETLLAEAGSAVPPRRIFLLCYPRILGFVFNPLSIYYCYGGNGEISAIIYEVRNTFGERHAYVAPVIPRHMGTDGLRQCGEKRFFVSPFIPMAAQYRFTLRNPGRKLHVLIRETLAGRPLLVAAFDGRRRDLSDRQLAVAFFRYPLMTLKVVAAINFEALRLWLKGVKIVPRISSGAAGTTILGDPAGDNANDLPREAAE